jgi:hypothetical protein
MEIEDIQAGFYIKYDSHISLLKFKSDEIKREEVMLKQFGKRGFL